MRIIKEARENWRGEEWFGFSLVMILLVLCGIGLYSLIATVRADAMIDDCYVTWETPPVQLPGPTSGAYVIYGHVPWRHDRILGDAKTSDDAHALMQRVCPVPTQ